MKPVSIIISLFVTFISSAGHTEPVTWAQQLSAREKIGQLALQKQQAQSQIANNNSQISTNQLEMGKIMAQMVAAGYGNVSSSGIPTDVDAGLKLASLKDDYDRLKKMNKGLESQNQNLQNTIQGLDNQIVEQSSILSRPTKPDLQNDANNYDQTLKNHEDYINWLKGKGKPQKEIDDAIWNRDNDKRRQDQIKQQIKDGDFRDTAPPPTSTPVPKPNQQGAIPTGPTQEQLTAIIEKLQDKLNQMQASPPPGWSPVGESVAGPYKPSMESQLASAQAAQQNIEANNAWHHQQQIQNLQNQIAQLQQSMQNGSRPPPIYDWNSWLQQNSIPPQPTGGESGHSHNPDGSDAGGSASDMM